MRSTFSVTERWMIRVIIQHEATKRKINNKCPCWQDNHSLPKVVRWLKLWGSGLFDLPKHCVLRSSKK